MRRKRSARPADREPPLCSVRNVGIRTKILFNGMAEDQEFKEIAHSGGKVTFHISQRADGGCSYQVEFRGERAGPTVIFAVYALPQGIAVGTIQLGGIGQRWNDPPCPDCVPVFYASDNQGKFGHHCPNCRAYWRSNGSPSICPYCAARGNRHDFLSEAQRVYCRQYCEVLGAALRSGQTTVIDMDAVADAARKDVEKPPFYYAEETQQNRFTCSSCGEFNDILGRFAYCCVCGTRNDLQESETRQLQKFESAQMQVDRLRIVYGTPSLHLIHW